jgi:hypothetical protein
MYIWTIKDINCTIVRVKKKNESFSLQKNIKNNEGNSKIAYKIEYHRYGKL